MADLRVKYLGLDLKNPIVAGSSGLTNSLADIAALEQAGIGAVVLKSIFEEEILVEMKKSIVEMQRPGTIYPEIYDFFDFSDAEDSLTRYLNLVGSAKKETKLPVIASVNCISANEWPQFARRIEEAGADALELNVFVLPSDFNRSARDNEQIYFDVVSNVKSMIKIPISLKISYYFSNLARMIRELSETGVAGLTLFNRFYSPDIDLEELSVVPANIYSSPADISISLRWIAIMANRVKCDLAASTGIHDGKAVIKQILAGATAVHVASTLYKNGPAKIQAMVADINKWMDANEFAAIEDFRGKLSQSKTFDPAAYERAQFMKYFSGRVML